MNPLGIKGIGELGNVGMNAAVANAVYHATGLRVREIPIGLEQLLKAQHLFGRSTHLLRHARVSAPNQFNAKPPPG
jgi:hypothetical protein